jgi:hypothetical protein
LHAEIAHDLFASGGDAMRGEDLEELLKAIIPDEVLESLVREAKLQERARKLDPLALVRATLLAAAAGHGGREAAVMRQYFELGSARVVRGGFYAWFNPSLERVLEGVRDRCLAYVDAQPRDLPGVLGAHVRDWHIVDSTTIRLHDALMAEYPGAGDYAALKVHKRYSVGVGTTIGYHLSPARDHDAPHLRVDASWRGLGLLVDLGYASHDLLRACEEHDVRYVIRLKENWKPKVKHIARGTVSRTFFPGTDLDALLADETIVLDGKVIDADVSFGHGVGEVHCRLVGVPAPDKGYRFYLTNLPPTVGPHQVSDLYRVRWEIESDNKLDKSCSQLDEILAQKGESVRALVHASIVSSTIACLIAHRHRLLTRPADGEPPVRTKPPLHPRLIALALATAAPSVAAAFALRGAAARAEWDRIAKYLVHLSEDPNWRRTPSILDQLRGWPAPSAAPKKRRLSARQFAN